MRASEFGDSPSESTASLSSLWNLTPSSSSSTITPLTLSTETPLSSADSYGADHQSYYPSPVLHTASVGGTYAPVMSSPRGVMSRYTTVCCLSQRMSQWYDAMALTIDMFLLFTNVRRPRPLLDSQMRSSNTRIWKLLKTRGLDREPPQTFSKWNTRTRNLLSRSYRCIWTILSPPWSHRRSKLSIMDCPVQI